MKVRQRPVGRIAAAADIDMTTGLCVALAWTDSNGQFAMSINTRTRLYFTNTRMCCPASSSIGYRVALLPRIKLVFYLTASH
jgi:hypothetical protein